VDTKAATCGYTMAWPTWTQYENFSAIHNVPLATKANGLEGMDAEMKIDSPLHVKHLQNMMDMVKGRVMKYGGRDGRADALFPSGECAIFHGSSGMRGPDRPRGEIRVGRGDAAVLQGHFRVPQRTALSAGQASGLMTLAQAHGGRVQGRCGVSSSTSRRPEVGPRSGTWIPLRADHPGRIGLASGQGYYINEPGADIPFRQLTLTEPTKNSMGLRLGNMPEIRVVIQEEMEKAFQGQQTAKAALDSAVKRSNVILAELRADEQAVVGAQTDTRQGAKHLRPSKRARRLDGSCP